MTSRNRMNLMSGAAWPCLALAATLTVNGATFAAGPPDKARISGGAKDDPSLARARQLYARARALGEAGNYQEAYKTLQETWSLHKHWIIVGYLGYLELKLGKYRESAEHTVYALRSLDQKADASDRQDLEDHLAEAKKKLETVELTGVEFDAKVLVDGRERDPGTYQDPVFLEPGEHRIEVRRVDKPTVGRTVRAEAGTAVSLDMSLGAAPVVEPAAAVALAVPDLKATQAPAASTPAAPEKATPTATSSHVEYDTTPRSSSSGARAGLIVGGAVLAAAGLAAGIGFWITADHKADDRDALVAGLPSGTWRCGAGSALPECATLRQLNDDRVRARNLSTAGFAVFGVAAAATVTLALWPHHGSRQARMQLVPTASPTEAGLVFRTDL